MATVLFDGTAPYYTVQVAFDGHNFEQPVVSFLVGDDLSSMLDGYGADYEWQYGLLEVSGETDEPASNV